MSKPTASGRLATTPLSHILVYLADKQLSGTLIVETPEGQKSAVYVRVGAPAKVRTAEPVIYLGRLLVDLGAIDQQTHDASLKQAAEQQKLHGQVLLAARAIDAQVLKTALTEQVARKVVWMFRLPQESAYGFYEGANFLERWGGPESTTVDPLTVLWSGIRGWGDGDRPEALATRLAATVLRLHVAATPARFGFTPKERGVLDVLRAKPQTLEALLGSGLGDPMIVKRVVYALSISRHLDLGDPNVLPVGVNDAPASSRRPPPRETNTSRRTVVDVEERGASAAAGGQSPPAPGVEAPEIVQMRKQILERAESIEKDSYYEILGVASNAAGAQIQAAFFSLAKTWHPDRVRPELADQREPVTRIFARMSEAHQMLSDDLRRREYDEMLKKGGDDQAEQEKVQRVLRAATNFQKAEVLMRKRDMAQAESLAQKAYEDDPEQAEYGAFYAWIQAQKADRQSLGRYDDLVKILDHAVAAEPNHRRIHFYRAQVMKLAGRIKEAMREFRWVVEHEPNNVEAKRELRLYEMRRGAGESKPEREVRTNPETPGRTGQRGKQPAAEKGGLQADVGALFGKLFKK